MYDLTIAHPSQSRHHVPDIDTPGTAELAQCQLHEVERPPYEEKDQHVGDEEGTPAILVGSEGKSPDVTQSYKLLNIFY